MNELTTKPQSERDPKEEIEFVAQVPVVDEVAEKAKKERMERIRMAMSSSARQRRRDSR